MSSNTPNPLLERDAPLSARAFTENSLNELKLRLEKKAMDTVIRKNKESPTGLISERDCISVMQQGAAEFAANAGREMTYSEMRAMYG